MKDNNLFQAAQPTFPVQDQFQRTIIQFGLTKLEYAAIHLATGWWHESNMLPETIAQEAVQIAKEIFKLTDKEVKEFIEEDKPQSKLIDLKP